MNVWQVVGVLLGVIATGAFTWFGIVMARIDTNQKLQTEINKDLYEKNRDHDSRIKEIETIHHIRGCDEPMKPGGNKAYRSV